MATTTTIMMTATIDTTATTATIATMITTAITAMTTDSSNDYDCYYTDLIIKST